MPSHSMRTDNGKYDHLLTITLEGCTVTMQENEGRDGRGQTVFRKIHEFASEAEAEAFYQAECRRDPYYSPPTDEEITLQRGEPVYLEFSDERSHKFYEVTVSGVEIIVRYGRIGKRGQITCFIDRTAEAALYTGVQKIKDKLKRGYVRSQPSVSSSPTSSSPTSLSPTQQPEESYKPNSISYWLPEDFQVYVGGTGTVGINASQGSEARILPTVNQYSGEDGGYVAFYSRDPAKAVYSVGGGIYVVGQIRLKGKYIGRIFHPEGYENQDISAAPAFKELCRNTFGVEGWAGGDTGGWFGKANQTSRGKNKSETRLPDATQSSSSSEDIASSATQVLSATMQAGEEVFWQTKQLQAHSSLQIVAISNSPSFSFNLMADENFAYHFNPRSTEAQIVQNTSTRQHWGTEERLPLPQEMAFGQEFELTIAVQETELALYLNDTFLCHYRHRISPAQIDGLRLICGQGSLQVLSVKISDNIPEPVAAPEIQASSLESTDEEVEPPDLDIAQFARSAWQPIVAEGDGSLLASKFSGRPWLAQHESWLNCPCCNQPMQLFVQLNLNELPEPVRQEYGSGLLQMFHCVDANCDGQQEFTTAPVFYGRAPYLTQNVLIRLVEPTGEGAMPPLPMINGEPYENDFPAKTITGWLEIEDYPDIDDLMALVNGWDAVQNGSDAWDELVEQLGFADLDDYECHCPGPVEGDKLAGYPYWVQGMEYPGCPICHAPMRHVFQLGSDNNLPYMFGDMGTAHVLQCKTHKDQFAFVWSCG